MRIQTRKEAIATGATRYQGSSCKKGHSGLRWTGSGACIQCVKDKYIPTGGKKGNIVNPNRQKAKEAGEIYYFSGRPCKRGHFTKRRTSTGSCQECHNIINKNFTPDYSLRSKYGITLAKFNEMLATQKGVCKICDKPEKAIDKQTKKIRKLSVDHCHETNRVRGLLCSACNIGIGNLRHSPNLLRKAALYCEAV